jgi:hypothetical protein
MTKHIGIYLGGCNFVKLKAQLSIEKLITNSSLPTQRIKKLNLSIKHNKSLTLKEEKNALISTN